MFICYASGIRNYVFQTLENENYINRTSSRETN